MVIAIIAILAAMLFPVFAKAREKARQSSCSSNVKQILIGVLQYVQDYDETIPRGREGNDKYWNDGTGPISPYIKNTQIWACPSQNVSGASATPNSYGINRTYFHDARQTLASVDKPSEVIYFAEGGRISSPNPLNTGPDEWVWGGTCHWELRWPSNARSNVADAAYNDAGPTGARRPWPSHNVGTNCGFLDGHVKWIGTQALVGPAYGAADNLYDNQ